MLFHNIQLSQEVVEKLYKVFQSYNIKYNQLSELTYDVLFEEFSNIQLINEKLLLDVLKVIENLDKVYKLLDNVSESIWEKYYTSNTDTNTNFIIEEYESFFMEDILKDVKNNKIKEKIKELDFDNIQIKIDENNDEYYYSGIPKVYTKIIDNIFVLKKIIKFFNKINKVSLFDKNTLLKYSTYNNAVKRFKEQYINKVNSLNIIGNKISKETRAQLDKINNRTFQHLQEECSKNDELYNFFGNEYLDKHFNNLYTSNKKNNFAEVLIKSNADLYYSSGDRQKEGFFIVFDIYETYLNLINIYRLIESFSSIIKKYVSESKKIPYQLCDDKLLSLYQFYNIFPKNAKDTFFVMTYCLYLKANYEDVRSLIGLLLQKRKSSNSFARYDHTIEYGEIEVSLKLILEKFSIFIETH